MELEPEPKHKEWVLTILPLWDDVGQTVYSRAEYPVLAQR